MLQHGWAVLRDLLGSIVGYEALAFFPLYWQYTRELHSGLDVLADIRTRVPVAEGAGPSTDYEPFCVPPTPAHASGPGLPPSGSPPEPPPRSHAPASDAPPASAPSAAPPSTPAVPPFTPVPPSATPSAITPELLHAVGTEMHKHLSSLQREIY